MKGAPEYSNELRKKAEAYCNAKVDDLPLNYMMDYIPSDKDNGGEWSDAALYRELIWIFKNDDKRKYPTTLYHQVRDMFVATFARQLLDCFGNSMKDITLVPVPCSSATNYAFRWFFPVRAICETIAEHADAPQNGYMSCTYITDSIPDNYNKGHIAFPQVEWAKDELDGTNVVLLDDICASSRHILWAKDELQKVGANTIAAFVIGSTRI